MILSVRKHAGGYALPTTDPLAGADNLGARLPTSTWLLLGTLLIALCSNRWGIAPLAWVAPVPFMVAAGRLRGWRGQALLLLVLNVAYALSTLKIITAPLPAPTVLVFSIPAAVTLWLLLWVWKWITGRMGRVWGVYSFVALITLADWFGFAVSYSGAWATWANTQIDNLPLLQLASLGGLSLIGALMALVAGMVFLLLDSPSPAMHRCHYGVAAIALFGALGFGAVRLDHLALGPTLRVAGITTHAGIDHGIPSDSAIAANTDDLFDRSELAAQRGAQVVVWNEVATLISPQDEPALTARAGELARRHHIDLVMAYGVLLKKNPVLIDDKYEWFGPDGKIIEVYRKHDPAPTEPTLKGTAPIRVLQRPWGRAAGAICYDYDFPALARLHAKGGAGIVMVPGGDWRGIDPYHTLMVRARAIEGGMSVVRPVRDSTSMMFDAYGRIRARLGAWENNEGIMMGTVPTQHVRTLYTALGDWPAVVAGCFLLLAFARALRLSRAKL